MHCDEMMNTSEEDISLQDNNSNELCLHLSTATWMRDSHELFDYETRDVKRQSFFINKSVRVFRSSVDMQIVIDGQALPEGTSDYILSVKEKDGTFTVLPLDKHVTNPNGLLTSLLPKKLWLIVKHLPKGQYTLQEGDIIKLGRFKLKVKQLVKAGNLSLDLYCDENHINNSVLSPEESVTMQCRICLAEGGSLENPLICPCHCKGSIKHVHLCCLQRWISAQVPLTDPSQRPKICFLIKQAVCELCKKPFPLLLNINNNKVSIIDIPKVDAPFIVLENIAGSSNRGYHVISLVEGKELKLGRGHESDVRIADVSISRYHATISFNTKDHDSKFGTLVCLRRPQIVDKSNVLALQAGRTILELCMKQKPPELLDVMKANGYITPMNINLDCSIS